MESKAFNLLNQTGLGILSQMTYQHFFLTFVVKESLKLIDLGQLIDQEIEFRALRIQLKQE